MKDTMSTCLPASPLWMPPAPEQPRNRADRRVDRKALLAAVRARKTGGAVEPSSPTTDGVRATINQTLAGTAQALKQGLPGVDFLMVALRHGGAGQAEVFMKGTLPPEAAQLTAEVLEGLAKHFRAQAGTAAPPEVK